MLLRIDGQTFAGSGQEKTMYCVWLKNCTSGRYSCFTFPTLPWILRARAQVPYRQKAATRHLKRRECLFLFQTCV